MVRQLYGHMRDGSAVHGHTLGAGGLTATVLDMGGTITAIKLADRNIVLGLKDLAAYEASGWWNCLIGRYANRLRNGVTIAGQHYPLARDANGVTLHGGRGQSWGARLWRTVQADDAALTLQLVSPDGDQGFPGNVTAQMRFSVTPDALRLDYSAVTDAATVINLTNHLYFNLAGTGLVTDQQLQLNAGSYTPTDAHQIPTGEIAPVDGTGFDFRQATAIGARVNSTDAQMILAGGLDHNFVLNKSAPDALEWAARLADPGDELMLEVTTTQPGIQVYSTNNVKPGTLNAAGGEIHKRGGLALETQHFPDSPNRPDFPSTLLMPGETFRATTVLRVYGHAV
jgi:aldose 1-epimerase